VRSQYDQGDLFENRQRDFSISPNHAASRRQNLGDVGWYRRLGDETPRSSTVARPRPRRAETTRKGAEPQTLATSAAATTRDGRDA